MLKVLTITGHILGAKGKASVLLLSEKMAEQGNDVSIVTATNISSLSKRKNETVHPVNRWYRVSLENGSTLSGYIYSPLFHPFHPRGRFFNFLSGILISKYSNFISRELREVIAQADVILVESGFGVMLFRKMKKINSRARFGFLMSDSLATLGFHPKVRSECKKILPKFDLIRCPAEALIKELPGSCRAIFIPHGIEKSLFDQPTHNPFQTRNNAVSVGDMLFDESAIETLAKNFPDWNFHIYGKRGVARPHANIIHHGYVQFEELPAVFRHADVGLAPYELASGVEYISQSSLKMIQYTYCRLPIVAPFFAKGNREHVCSYIPGDETSIVEAFRQAIHFDRSTVRTETVHEWNELAADLLDRLA